MPAVKPDLLCLPMLDSILSSTKIHQCYPLGPWSRTCPLVVFEGTPFVYEGIYIYIYQQATATPTLFPSSRCASFVVYGVRWQLSSPEYKVRSTNTTRLLMVVLDCEHRVVGMVWAVVYLCVWIARGQWVGPHKQEYIEWMNRGREEAREEWGLPEGYIFEAR